MVWFLASFDLGPDVRIGYCRPDDSGQPTANSVTVADGSWAEVTLADEDGAHDVTESGDRAVWRIIEDAHETWIEHGSPGWERLGLTVAEDRQDVWLDEPTGPQRWPLPR